MSIKTTLGNMSRSLKAQKLMYEIVKVVCKKIEEGNENLITLSITTAIEEEVDNIVIIKTIAEMAQSNKEMIIKTLGDDLTIRIIMF